MPKIRMHKKSRKKDMVNETTLQNVQLICLCNKLLYTNTTLHDYRYKFINIWIQ